MSCSFPIGRRIALASPAILAKHIPAGTTGKIVDFVGHRAFEVIFDGDPRPVICFPENLARVASDAPGRPAPSPFHFKPRGKAAKQEC